MLTDSRQKAKTTVSYGKVRVRTRNNQHFDFLQPPEIGDLKYSIIGSDHKNWLICNGRSLSRTEYADLFALIGTSFGNDDANTFKLPDTRGRVIGSIGTGTGLTLRSNGDAVGTETHTLTTSEMPVHNHGVTDPGHTHSYINNTNNQNTDNAFASETAADDADLSKTTGSSTTGITINNAGGGQAHNNMQPTIFMGNCFIYSKVHNN